MTRAAGKTRIVMKFGGTSLADVERIQAVAQRVKREVDAGREAVCAHALDSKSAAVTIMHMNGATDTIMRAMGWSDRCRAIASVNSRV